MIIDAAMINVTLQQKALEEDAGTAYRIAGITIAGNINKIAS